MLLLPSAVANSSMTFHIVIVSLSTFIHLFWQTQDTVAQEFNFDLHYHRML